MRDDWDRLFFGRLVIIALSGGMTGFVLGSTFSHGCWIALAAFPGALALRGMLR